MRGLRRTSTSSSDSAASDKRRRRNGSARRSAGAPRTTSGMRSAADTSKARSFSSILDDDFKGSADADLAVGNELVGRHGEIGGRRPLPDAAGGVVLRAVARAEPAVVVALMGERNAAEMRADADDHQPLIVALLHALGIRLPVGQGLRIDLLRLLDFFLAAMADEDRLRAPEHLDDLP